MHHIKGLQTIEVGGMNTVDFVELADGRVLGINAECVVLYDSIDAFYEADGSVEYDSITLIK
jgi:hypothetical protein